MAKKSLMESENIEEDQVNLKRLKTIEDLIKTTPFKVENYRFLPKGGGENICFEDGTRKRVPKGVAIIYNLLKSKDKSTKEQLSLIEAVAENIHTVAPSNQQFYQTIIAKK